MNDTPSKDGTYSRRLDDGTIEVFAMRGGEETVRFAADQNLCMEIISRLFVEIDASAKQNPPAEDSLFSVPTPPPAMIGALPLKDPNFVALSLVIGASRLLVPIPTEQVGQVNELLAQAAKDAASQVS